MRFSRAGRTHQNCLDVEQTMQVEEAYETRVPGGDLISQHPSCQKDSCNLMWTAVRPRSTELKLQNMELK